MERSRGFVVAVFAMVLVVFLGGCSRASQSAADGGDDSHDQQAIFDFASRVDAARFVQHRDVVDFGAPEDRHYLLEGWGQTETHDLRSFTWATARVASLEMELFHTNYQAVEFQCFPFVFDGAPPQVIDLKVNGAEVGSIVSKRGSNSYVLPLPDSALSPGSNRLTFSFRYAEAPSDRHPDSGDRRTLAVAFQWLRLRQKGQDLNPTVGPARDLRPEAQQGNLTIGANTSLVYTLTVPEGAVLKFGMDAANGQSAALTAGEVRVRRPDTSTEIVVSTNDPAPHDRRWEIDLSGMSGNTVEICFSALGRGAVTWQKPRLTAARTGFDAVSNVLLVVVDTLREDHVGCYGGSLETPNIDSLAATGVRFANAYAHIPITMPSHSSLFTSKLPPEHGVHNNAQILAQEHAMLAESLRATFRRTAAFISLGVLAERFGAGQGFDEYHDVFGEDWWKDAGEINRKVLPWLTDHSNEPFFLWVHYSDPHEPYAPPGLPYPHVRVKQGSQLLETVAADGRIVSLSVRLNPGSTFLRFEGHPDDSDRELVFRRMRLQGEGCEFELGSGWDEFTKRFGGPSLLGDLPATVKLTNHSSVVQQATFRFLCTENLDLPALRERYAQEVEFLDRQIGRLLETLEIAGLRDNTLVVFTSDHGEGLGDHDLMGHISQLYDTLLRVPLIVSFPGRLPEGVVVDDLARHIDIYPTIADLLRFKAPPGLQGASLLPMIGGGSEQRPLVAMTYRPEASVDRDALLVNGFKYIVSHGKERREELYHLANDPTELSEISERHPAITEELRIELARILADKGCAGAASPEDAQLSDDDREQLRALGYLH